MGQLTTHVLDTLSGRPGAGVRIRLFHGGQLLVESRTGANGRTVAPILAGDALLPGRYRLEFDVGDYYRGIGVSLPEPAFLDMVPVEFGMADGDAHYHVPLLISPFAYSTYRGS
ncbi:hydroxyisourate hydrolase [Sphingomonas sp. CL5.1]|uniref:hydroxyisourate hydrolase n=1 Tax=Sphingomonas sp. CL5.1 TaxID=2653203 RepID=UPI001583C101|nr:hydroxyisourate hydrolase [Sphingomonas sp. CL5.1]QKS02131.1 hydroxyisourate hydrolase [Sphingomonas sp. CL5.1]